MPRKSTLYVLLFLLTSCQTPTRTESSEPVLPTDVANDFVDAFYSFDRDSLASILSLADKSHPNILYYQKWAECANYKIFNRGDLIEKNDSTIICPVTVKDDLMGSLKIDFNVTDSFHISIRGGRIISVETSSNDLPVYYEAKEWVKKNRPDLIEKACEGIWEGGPTPCECVQGVIKGFEEFTKQSKSE